MDIINYIKSNQNLKKKALAILMPKNQARPRFFIKVFINPFFHKKGKNTLIRRRSRLDLMPFNKFILGSNSTIEDFSTINNGVGDVIIGENTRIGLGNTIIGPVEIGNDVRTAQNVVMSGLNHNYENVKLPIHEQGVSTKLIRIGAGSWIGSNVVILPGVSIGVNSVIAAGSIVTKNVDDFAVYAGNPARKIKYYNHSNQKWIRITS